jgi:hypothetical protein
MPEFVNDYKKIEKKHHLDGDADDFENSKKHEVRTLP